MLAIQITANVFLLTAIGISCIFFGFIFRQTQLHKKAMQIVELEKEMLKNHAEIIELHRKLDLLSKEETKTGATILKLKDDSSINDEKGNVTGAGARKKLLRKTSTLK